jgi:hypothetical protein
MHKLVVVLAVSFLAVSSVGRMVAQSPGSVTLVKAARMLAPMSALVRRNAN